MDREYAQNMNFGLLKFCLEHMDDPGDLADAKPKPDRDPKDYEFLLNALGDLETETLKAIKLLNKLKETKDIFEIKAYLEGLQYFCEDLDVSQGILKVKGLETIMEYISHEDAEIRFISAWAVASILASNVVTQNYAIEINALEPLVKALENEVDVGVLGKQIYAISAALGSPYLTQNFIDLNGIKILNKHLSQVKSTDTDSSKQTKAKIIWVFSKIIITIPDSKLLFAEQGTIDQLFETLKEDQNIAPIRRNIISFLDSVLRDAPDSVKSCFKSNPFSTIDLSLLDDEEKEDLNSIQNKIK